MEKSFKTYLVLAILCTFVFISWGIVRIVKVVSFDLNCGAYLKRAAEANTVEIAKGELVKALNYMENNNLTEGVVSIFLKNPTNDIGFWYNNIKSANEELNNLTEDATALEKTNVLMKLRESITDRDNGNTAVTVPTGISIYPNNISYFIWGSLALIGTCVFWTFIIIILDKQGKIKIKIK